MKELKLDINPAVELVFAKYPNNVQNKLRALRSLIIETAQDIEGLDKLEETLKWGEPSYLTKNGSTIRIDWKAKTPEQYTMYFKCTSRLVTTFKMVYQDRFSYEGKRAIVFKINDEIPREELKSCIKAALCYHKVKQLVTLGI